MKVAMWGVGLLVLSLLGIIIVNLFGNITVTDQLNYTTMKNTVEAAMYDSLDVSHFRTGFCLCTNLEKNSGKWIFNSSDQYELLDITYENGKDVCKSSKFSKCEAVYGEYRIKPKTFSESLVRRFAEMVNNNKDYEIVIQDIIEYPPKVSVRVTSRDKKFSPTEVDSDGGYQIVNQIDAIIEAWPGVAPATPKPTATPTPKVTATPTATPKVPKNPTPTPKVTATPTPKPATSSGTCTWHHNAITVTCKKTHQSCTGIKLFGMCLFGKWETVVDDTQYKQISAQSGYKNCGAAKSGCESKASKACDSGYTASYSCEGYQSWDFTCSSGASGSFSKSCSNTSPSCGGHCSSSTVTYCHCKG